MLNNFPIPLTQSEEAVLERVLRADRARNTRFTNRQCGTVLLISALIFIALAMLAWVAIQLGLDDEIKTRFAATAKGIDEKDIYIVALLLYCFYTRVVAERRAALLRKFYAYLSHLSPDRNHST